MDKSSQPESPSLTSSPSMQDKHVKISIRTSCPPENGQFQSSVQKQGSKSDRILAQGNHFCFKMSIIDEPEHLVQQIHSKDFKRDKIIFKTFGATSEDEDDSPLLKYGKHLGSGQSKQKSDSPGKNQSNNEHIIKQQKKEKLIQRKQPQLTFLSPEQDFDNKNSNKIEKVDKNNESECYFQVTCKRWEIVNLRITKSKIAIGPVCIDMGNVMKIKIFPSEVCSDTKSNYHIESLVKYRDSLNLPRANTKLMKQNIIKIVTAEDTVFHFGQRYAVVVLSEPKEMYSESTIPIPQSPTYGPGCRLPLPFLSFAKITLKKLKQLYPSIRSTDWQLPQFPLRAVIKKSSAIVSSLPAPFARYCMKNFAFIHGKIYKKSQHKSKWEKRYVIINETGIYSYRDQRDEIFSYSIESKSIKYLWTWFTILRVNKKLDTTQINLQVQYQQQEHNVQVDHFGRRMANQLKKARLSDQQQVAENQNAYLIIKIKHGFNGQTEFGIPVCGFDNQINKPKNWLFAFYKILSQYEY